MSIVLFFIGEVLVTKNPCLYPGDIRRLVAVNIRELQPFIRDCIVFPVLGSRPHFNEISVSDLDGDQYWVYWGKELRIPQVVSPLSYTPASKRSVPEVTPELIVNHILDTLDDQTSGIISNTHSVIADKDPDGTGSVDCKYLAELFPRAIDSIKTGEQINMEVVNQLREKYCTAYPTWMMKDDKSSYKSESINGYLFYKAQTLTINGFGYHFMYKKYDRMNQDIAINIGLDDDANELQKYRDRILSNVYEVLVRFRYSSTVTALYRPKYLLMIVILCLVIYFNLFKSFYFIKRAMIRTTD